jgi:hypothetical protein
MSNWGTGVMSIHYEILVLKRAGGGWILDGASPDRGAALGMAASTFAAGGVLAVRVMKETLDSASGNYQSVSVQTLGVVPKLEKATQRQAPGTPLCVSPQDLYTTHARERISRLLENWLVRRKVTAFELLHRPDLAEDLADNPRELEHAIQKISIPEAQFRNLNLHDVLKSFKNLSDRTVKRLMEDGRKSRLPKLGSDRFATLIEAHRDEPDRDYLLGAAIASGMAPLPDWRAKIDWLVAQIEDLDGSDAGSSIGLRILEQPLLEILGGRAALSDLFEEGIENGDILKGMAQIACLPVTDLLMSADARLARSLKPLGPTAARLGHCLDRPQLRNLRNEVFRRVLKDLAVRQRLHSVEMEEIDTLRHLAMILTAGRGEAVTEDDILKVFAERSQSLVSPAFVDPFLASFAGVDEQVSGMLHLLENVTGDTNKRKVAQWIGGQLDSLKFEAWVRSGSAPVAMRLARLAEFQRRLLRVGMTDSDTRAHAQKLSDFGTALEKSVDLVRRIALSDTPTLSRLNLLLELAMGQTAPTGPVGEKAREQIMSLLRVHPLTEEFQANPDLMGKVRKVLSRAA